MKRYCISLRITQRYTIDLIVLAHTRYEFGYHLVLCAVSMDDIDPIEVEISLVGAVLGGVLEHTSEFKFMKYDEAMKMKDRDKW